MQLSNFKIATKIGTGFAIIVVLVIALGAIALSQLSAVATGEEQIATNNLPSVQAASQLSAYVNSIRRFEARHVLATSADEMDARETDITSVRKQLADFEPTAARFFNSEFEIKAWNSFKAHRDDWYAQWEKLRPLSRKSVDADRKLTS